MEIRKWCHRNYKPYSQYSPATSISHDWPAPSELFVRQRNMRCAAKSSLSIRKLVDVLPAWLLRTSGNRMVSFSVRIVQSK